MNSKELALSIRKHAIEMVHKSNASHIGAILSCVDIIAVLYADVMKYRSNDPRWELRDRFVMSKGHAGVAVYAALAECGFFPIEKLDTYYQNGSKLSGHVSHKGVPGVEVSTGSLGHGIAIACGMAIYSHRIGNPWNVYSVIGDGEMNEGTVWETAMLANQLKLDNFTVIVDRNNLQAMGPCNEIINLEPLADKWQNFGWTVIDLEDGNDHESLKKAFSASSNGKPKVIIARTVKGCGVSFMENKLEWHYKSPQGEIFENAMSELSGEIK